MSTPINNSTPKICLSVDVEEYFHAANLSSVCPIKNWHNLPSRVEQSTYKLLDCFDQNQSKGTFFVLAYCAKRYPNLIKEIKKRGHEIASHGYAHKIAYLQSEKQFSRDIRRSKQIIEDITGESIKGYRAPNFSITEKNKWAYECLINSGYIYDSSLNPVAHSRYGNTHRKTTPEIIVYDSKKLIILPLTTYTLTNKIRIPIAGGAYWRLLPKSLIIRLLKSNTSHTSLAPICYLHPWEVDPEQPYFSQIPTSKKIRHYYGQSTFLYKVDSILKIFKSDSIENCYLDKSNELLSYPS